MAFEDDGTEVEDEAYFQSAPKETVFLLLRQSETWQPAAMDALKSGKSDTFRCIFLMTKRLILAFSWSC